MTKTEEMIYASFPRGRQGFGVLELDTVVRSLAAIIDTHKEFMERRVDEMKCCGNCGYFSATHTGGQIVSRCTDPLCTLDRVAGSDCCENWRPKNDD